MINLFKELEKFLGKDDGYELNKLCNWAKKFHKYPYDKDDHHDDKLKYYKEFIIDIMYKNPFTIPTLSLRIADKIYKYLNLDQDAYEKRKIMGIILRQCHCKSNGIKYDSESFNTKMKDYNSDIGFRLVSNSIDKRDLEEYGLSINYSINSNGEECTIIHESYINYIELFIGEYLCYKTFTTLLKNVKEDEIIDIIHDLNKNPDEDLLKALSQNLKVSMSIFTGAAGTGKSLVVEIICLLCEERGIDYRVVSFTGKAISNLLNRIDPNIDKDNFSTIHSLWGKLRNGDIIYPLGDGVLILEESSMTSSPLFYRLLKRLVKLNVRLQIFMVGDANQLPPIGWGKLFINCINSGRFIVSTLKRNYRTNDDSGALIISNSNNFIQDVNTNNFIWHDEYCQRIFDKDLKIALQLYGNIDNYDKVMIISPWNKRKDEINKMCQNELRQLDDCVRFNFKLFHINDKVIITRNSNKDKVYNGTEGIIINIYDMEVVKISREEKGKYWYIDSKTQKILSIHPSAYKEDFIKINCRALRIKLFKDDRIIKIPLISVDNRNSMNDDDETELKKLNSSLTVEDIDLSYCITTHKSQGSESQIIVIDCLTTYDPSNIIPGGRSNIYTALTRTKNNFVYNGLPIVMEKVHKNHEITHDRLTYILKTI